MAQKTGQPADSPLMMLEDSLYLMALNALVGYLSINEAKPLNELAFCAKHEVPPSFLLALRDLDGLVYDFKRSDTETAWYTATMTLPKLTPEQVHAQMTGVPAGKVKTAAKATIEFFKAADNVRQRSVTVKIPADVKEQINAIVADATTETNRIVDKMNAALDDLPKPAIVKSDNSLTGDNATHRLVFDINKAEGQAAEMLDNLIDMAKSNPCVTSGALDAPALTLAQPYRIDIMRKGLRFNMEVKDGDDLGIVDALLNKLNKLS